MEISGHRTEAVYRRNDIVSKQDLVAAGLRMQAYRLQNAGLQPARDGASHLDTVKVLKDAAQRAGRKLGADEQTQIAALQEKAAAAMQQAAALGFPLSNVIPDTGANQVSGTSKAILQ